MIPGLLKKRSTTIVKHGKHEIIPRVTTVTPNILESKPYGSAKDFNYMLSILQKLRIRSKPSVCERSFIARAEAFD